MNLSNLFSFLPLNQDCGNRVVGSRMRLDFVPVSYMSHFYVTYQDIYCYV